jgi:hypothetical protein
MSGVSYLYDGTEYQSTEQISHLESLHNKPQSFEDRYFTLPTLIPVVALAILFLMAFK